MTTKADILSAIRRKCLECCCGQPGEVRACHITACELWPFRFGNDPAPSTSRGFAKSSVHTGDFLHDPPSRQSGSPQAASFEKSPVHTNDFERDDVFPRSRSTAVN